MLPSAWNWSGRSAFGLEVEEVLAEFLGVDALGSAPEVLAQLAHAGRSSFTLDFAVASIGILAGNCRDNDVDIPDFPVKRRLLHQ